MARKKGKPTTGPALFDCERCRAPCFPSEMQTVETETIHGPLRRALCYVCANEVRRSAPAGRMP